MPQLSMHKRDGSLVPYPTACCVRRRLVGVILKSEAAALVSQSLPFRVIPAFDPMRESKGDAEIPLSKF